MRFLKICLFLITPFFIQSCFFVAGAAAGAAAVAVVYDHRNVETILEDQRIDRTITHKLNENPELLRLSHVDVTSFGQVVLLSGETPDQETRQKVEDITRQIKGVKRIFNAISIQGPTSSLTRASDTWITTKIKSVMLAKQGLKSATIKVVTENGVVYLMGSVSKNQEDIVVDIARHTTGVQKVVKIFQYIDAPKIDAPIVDASKIDAPIEPTETAPALQPIVHEE